METGEEEGGTFSSNEGDFAEAVHGTDDVQGAGSSLEQQGDEDPGTHGQDEQIDATVDNQESGQHFSSGLEEERVEEHVSGSPTNADNGQEEEEEEDDQFLEDAQMEVEEETDDSPAQESDEEGEEENRAELNVIVEPGRGEGGRRLMRDWLRYLRLPRLPRSLLQRLRRHRYAEVFENLRFRGAEDGMGSSEDEDTQNLQRPENITFDQSLPTSHSYLGDLDDCSGIQYMDQESYVILPILRIPDLILVPGQTLPLNMTRLQDIALMNHVVSRQDKTFGVILSVNRYDPEASTVDMGCTAELRSIRQEEEYEVPTMVGLAIGRQRFKIMEKRPQPDGNLFAKVQILGDDELSPPASGARLGIHHKVHITPIETGKGNKTKRSHEARAAWLTSNPPWSYNMYDVGILRSLLIKELKDWNHDLNEKLLPVSPTAFSFWVAAHLCITNTMRLYLLKIDTAIQRLRCELDLIKKCTIYACSDCGNHITEKQDVFSMSLSGPMAAYVNPSGTIHETLTVYKSRGLSHVSRPSTEHSWFPGYAWTICECSDCGRHMGWKFTATKSELMPKKFWGLTRSGLSPKIMADTGEDEFDAPGSDSAQRGRVNSESSVSSSQNTGWRPIL